jgi:hypothetical protein
MPVKLPAVDLFMVLGVVGDVLVMSAPHACLWSFEVSAGKEAGYTEWDRQ